jgi:uncharacterized protein (TIGR02099 family)
MALTGFVAVACVLLLVVRYVALPQLESRRAEFASLLSRQLGQPVDIESIAAGWDGWNPEVSVRGLTVRDRTGASTLPLLELPDVTGVISWTSLPRGRLHFKELSIDRPRLAIRRDTAGRIHVAGIEIDPESTSDDTGFVEWLLLQRKIVVRDALITWNDDRRNAPQLVLDNVHFRMERVFGRHRIGLTGTPPPEIAAPIDVRADLVADSLRDWQRARGELYVRLDYADLAAWSEWLPLPIPLESGKGALRTWFGITDGVVESVVADLELEDVRAKLRRDLPPLDLVHVAGHVSVKQGSTEREVATRALTVAPRNGLPLGPLDFSLAYRVDGSGQATEGEARADRIELEPLAAIAAQLPIPTSFREQLAGRAPRGVLADATYAWKGPVEAPVSFRGGAKLRDVGVRAQGDAPGITGLSGAVEATEKGGTLRLDSRGLAVAMPAVFPQPIALDTAAGEATWERSAEALSVRGRITDVANADLAASATFAWQSRAKGPGTIDLDGKVSRVDGRRLERYVPLQLSSGVRAWLAHAIPQGSASDGTVVLKGDLAEFPFPSGRNGQFLVTAKVRGATLDYVPREWPPITDIDADLRFEGSRLLVQAARGRSLGATIGRVTAEIPDLRAPRLKVDGEASGPTSEFLAFVSRSPIAGWVDHATDALAATGNGKLAVRFELGLADFAHNVTGEFQFLGNQLRIPGVPELSQLAGALKFSDREMRATDLAFEALGGPARATIVASGDAMNVTASGNARVAQVRAAFPSRWLEHANGAADWKLALEGRRDGSSWNVESSLKGVAIELPAPFGKVADAAVPLRVERRPLPNAPARDQLRVDYGSMVRVVADRRVRDGEASADRALLLLGRAVQRGGEPERTGIVIRGDVDAINLDDWVSLAQSWEEPVASAQSAAPPEVVAVDLVARELDVGGRAFHDTALSARRSGSDWRVTLASKEVEGTATWEPRSSKFANGRVTARLARFAMPGAGTMATWHGSPRTATPRGEGSANPWPEIELVADRFHGRRGELGRLELSAKPQGADWRIDKFSLANDAGSLSADGWWRSRGPDQQTRLDVALDVRDAGAFLARFGMPDAVKGAPTKIDGQLAWKGSPDEFDYATLAGTFKVNVGAGQFTKIEPGIGKLLGVLSLQALPRRITLDFRDVFSEGFAFDTITGNVRVGNGVLHTENLQLNGPAARVMITGEADLKTETQKLNVVVQPSLATSVSAGAGAAAVLLLAHPAVAAVVGAGTLLAQKVMKDPIEQIFSYEYLVRGSWDEPLVDRVSRNRLGTSADAGGTVAPGR